MTAAADPRALDRTARAAAQREFRRPLAVEAGAGTGKTSILVARILAWSLGDGWAAAADEGDADAVAARVLEGLVAITFTEAAAAEMATRAAEGLRTLELGEVPPWLDEKALPAAAPRRRRARALLGALHRLRVGTIHSFCSGLLRQFPVEAEVAPGFTVDAGGALLDDLVREVVEGGLRGAFAGGDPAPWLALAETGIGPEGAVRALVALAGGGASSDLLRADPFAGGARFARGRLTRAVDAFVTAGGGRLATVSRRSTVTLETADAVATLPARLEALPDDDGMAGWTALAAVVKWLDSRVLKRISTWGNRRRRTDDRFTGSEAKALGDALSAVAEAAADLAGQLLHLSSLDPPALDAARRALAPMLAEVTKALRRDGVLTYQMLLAGAASLLERPGMAARVRRGIRQLLVDEFQDTDRLQCAVVRRLALEGPPEERPGLFVVGDPKQSIYGWRNADLAAYESLVGEVVAAGGELHHLVVNFRSVPAVLDEVERAVAPVMVREPRLQPEFEPLLACEHRAREAGFTAAGRAPLEYWVSWPGESPGDGRRAEVVELEARSLAADLAELHAAAGMPWGDAAVLLRSFGDVDTLLQALREAGVPYQVARDREYFRSREVAEAAALVRAVLDPADELALLTVLRSDTVGVPDAALRPLWREGLTGAAARLTGPDPDLLATAAERVRRAAAAVPAGVSGLDLVPGWEASLLWALHALAELRHTFATEPPDVFVERLRTLWLGEATAAARYLGGFRRARLERFLGDLEEILADGRSPAAVVRTLRRRIAEESELDEPVVPEGDVDAVQVMTIHGAKGLDFRHVYLLDLDRGPAPGGAVSADAELKDEATLAYSLFGWSTPAALAAAEDAARVEAAERVRLLYVAMTRAKDRLVLVGRWPAVLPDTAPSGARTMLDLLLHRGSADVLAVVDTGGVRDPFGVLWRRCGGSGVVAPQEGDRPAAEPPPAVGSAERRVARVRQERPLSAPASAEAHRLLDEIEEPDGGARAPRGSGDAERGIARAAGTLVHEVLEHLDLAGDLEAQWGAARAAARSREESGAVPKGTAARVEEILGLLERGPLGTRLAGLAGAVLARELPVLLPPEGDEGPVGFVTGVVDLVYRDSAGGLVVADYKTDRVSAGEEIAERAAVYAPQLRLYVRALQGALDFPEAPRAELWFLAAGVVVEVAGAGGPGA